MPKELPKQYNPADYEDDIYEKWEKSGFFNPDKLKGEPYSIMMPPPNVTGVLHLGHALENSLMDIMARYQRMSGRKVLLLPGTDHAAVATQAKVEKVLIGQGIKNPRQELGREKLLEKIRQYAEESKATILEQIKKMGTSCDWSRLAYTFDAARNRAVNEVFVKMYNDGLIRQDFRVVNWSVKGQSTCSDDEIVYVERPAKLSVFRYSKDFPISIATTRPETKLGDTAVAVNPRDKRYKKFIGKEFSVIGFGGAVDLKIKIIADEGVDMAFGTGALGVTPAHSSIDFEIYKKQKLKGEKIGIKQIISENGTLTANAGAVYERLTVIEARERVVKWLKENDLLEKEEEIIQNVGTSDRFGDIIEAIPMKQWFVLVNEKIPGKNKSLKDLMREAVTTGHKGDPKQKVKITPERFKKVYLNWIDNLHDWCISRQIWWGHRIPVYYSRQGITNYELRITNEIQNANVKDEIYVGVDAPKGQGWTQDPDTLDTWFSSGLWTFSTLGWTGQKIWDLKIYDGKKIFESLKAGTKRFETRAGKPEGADKDWRQFKAGDIINFSLVKEGTERLLSKEIITKQIVSIHHFKTIDELLKTFDLNEIHPYKPEQYRPWWETRPKFKERIEKYGIWAFELETPLSLPLSGGRDLGTFHPTSWMQMGYEILFFWMARMILMSTYALDQIPFKDVYIHGMLRNEAGKKFSKSAGDNIDPLEIIKKYGTDALRLSLISGIAPGNDSKFYEEKVEGARNLVNKLWNVARYIITNYELKITNYEFNLKDLTLFDKWILLQARNLILTTAEDLNNYRFSQAEERLKEFTWNDLADWYLEACKFEKNSSKDQILSVILNDLLKLWHPFIPFVTEAIWRETGNKNLLFVEKYPRSSDYNDFFDKTNHGDFYPEIITVQKIIIAIRNARAENKIEPNRKIKAVIYTRIEQFKKLIESSGVLIKGLKTGISELEIKIKGEKIAGAIYAAVGEIEIYLLGAVDAAKEKIRLEKEIVNLEKIIKAAEGRLANQEFVKKAPAEVVKKEKDKLKGWRAELKKIREQMENLK